MSMMLEDYDAGERASNHDAVGIRLRAERKLNIARRNLDRATKRRPIEDELKDRPERSDGQIAAELGVDHGTVGSIRTKLEDGGEIYDHDTRTGRDGVKQPAVSAAGH